MFRRRTLLLMPLMAMPAVAQAQTLPPQEGDASQVLQGALDAAAGNGGVVKLGAGTFRCSDLQIAGNVLMEGIPGQTVLRLAKGNSLIRIRDAAQVTMQGLSFSAKGTSSLLIEADSVKTLRIENCSFAGGGTGLSLRQCGGHIHGNSFTFQQAAGLHCLDSRHLKISANTFTDIGNNAIRVWRGDKGEDGTIVSENHIARIAAEDGGDGQNGNGINVFRAGNVTISNNRISDCAFSAIRNNAGDGSVITGNSISRCNEVALYVEFGFRGAIVADNLIESAAHGISITNFNEGGRLAVCQGNVIRGMRGVNAHGEALGGGIFAEADTVVANNVIDEAEGTGILLGWGRYGRNLTAQGNTVLNATRGIAISALAEGPFLIANNLISGARAGAVLAMDHNTVVSGDLTLPGAKLPRNLKLHGNQVQAG